MKILITGAAGFIGSNFVHWLLKNTKDEIIGIDDLSTGFQDNIPMDNERFVFVRASICNQHAVNNAFDYFKPEVCYHMAAYAAEARSNWIRYFNHYNNTLGTAAVINACVIHNVKLIFLSSVAIYSGAPPFNEKTVPNPIDEYGLSKYMSEKSIQIAAENQGLKYVILRPRNVYGQRQSLWDSARNVFGIWMNQALNEWPITIIGTGNNKRCFTFIDDIMKPLYNAIGISGGIGINIGSPTPYSIMSAAIVFEMVTGWKEAEFLRPRNEVAEAICNTETQRTLLDYNNETSLFDGLTSMWKWAQRQPHREMTKKPELEIL